MTDTPTRGQAIAADVTALLRARNSLLWVITREEQRVERYLFQAAGNAGYVPHSWDMAQGVTDIAGNPEKIGDQDPGRMLESILDRSRNEAKPTRDVWIMRDLPAWLAGLPGAVLLRQMRNLARSLPTTPRDRAQSIIILTTSDSVPPDLAGHATVIEWPLPDRAEIAAVLESTLSSLSDDLRASAAPNGTKDSAIDAAVGLSGDEAASCYAKSLVQLKRIDPAAVAQEKKRVIARERVLEWFDPLPGGLDAVGGLDVLKGWLAARKGAYSAEARAYGLPAPKGALLAGISGCGKSLSAKAIATAWGVPLLRLDLGALKSKFVGESEGNLRKAVKVIEAIGRCVVWIDEIEKALAGSTGPQGDGGVSSDALGTILSWMQERQGQAFVIATANDISGLPPELLRKGRFDEIFFVDTPNELERVEVLAAALRKYGRDGLEIDAAEVAKRCDGFTGSEIAELVPDALFAAFADGKRELCTADLLNSAKGVVPLTTTMEEKIKVLRDWAKQRARPATSPLGDTRAQDTGERQIDIG